MSAGNVVLSSAVYGPTTFPYTPTLLTFGSYWIEEIDFTFSYVVTSAGVVNYVQILLNNSSPQTFWTQFFLVSTTAAITQPYNLSITSRPRIFIPRGQSISLNVTPQSATITAVAFSLNLYGRSLP